MGLMSERRPLGSDAKFGSDGLGNFEVATVQMKTEMLWR